MSAAIAGTASAAAATIVRQPVNNFLSILTPLKEIMFSFYKN
jgi:hypothetical protein